MVWSFCQVKEAEVLGRERMSEEMEAIQRENEELKDVLSAVQIDLESKTEVCKRERESKVLCYKLR